METNTTRMCELLVGLPDVNVNGVGDWPQFLRIAITTRAERPLCPGCDGPVWAHDRVEVERVDLPCFGRQTRLIWSKQRWRCPNVACAAVTFVETDERIADSRAAITDRAGRWATFQVGHHGRAVSEVAADLGCDWHTVMDAVVAHGRALIDDPNRIGISEFWMRQTHPDSSSPCPRPWTPSLPHPTLRSEEPHCPVNSPQKSSGVPRSIF